MNTLAVRTNGALTPPNNAPALNGLPDGLSVIIGGLGNLLLSGKKGDAVVGYLVAQNLVSNHAAFLAAAGQHRAALNQVFEYVDGSKLARTQPVQQQITKTAGSVAIGIAIGALATYLIVK